MTVDLLRSKPRTRPYLRALPWAVVLAWLVGTAVAFWYFELRPQRPFVSNTVALFDASMREQSARAWFRAHIESKRLAAAHAAATVVHVYRADCPCNRFTNAHLAEIARRYRARGVRFLAVESPASARAFASAAATNAATEGASHNPAPRSMLAIANKATDVSAIPSGVQTLPNSAGESAPRWIQSTPAALVFNESGDLVYFGPYSDAAWCSSSGGLVERALDLTLAGKAPAAQNLYSSGCYCDWTQT